MCAEISPDGRDKAGQDQRTNVDEDGPERPSFIGRLFGRGADAPVGGEPETETAEAAEVAAGERAMLHNIRKLRSLRVIDVMVPRGDVACLPVDAPLSDVIAAVRVTGHTRQPRSGQNAGLGH